MFDKYNSTELSQEIDKALNRAKENPKFEGIYTCLFLIPEKEQNSDGYVNASRYGYNYKTNTFDYLGCTDIMPFLSDNYQMDFIPGGINIFRKDRKPFHVNAECFTATIIDK